MTFKTCFRSCNGLPFFLGFSQISMPMPKFSQLFWTFFCWILWDSLKTYCTLLLLVTHSSNNLIQFCLVWCWASCLCELHFRKFSLCIDSISSLVSHISSIVLAGNHILSYFIQLNPHPSNNLHGILID